MNWRRHRLAIAGIAALGVLLAFGASFAWFVHQVDQPGEAPPHTDGIVAFTGGPERVETALRLMAEGRADHLLLSGIGGGAELTELAHRAGVDPLPLATRVTIGRSATTTRGNAAETAAWARANGIHSLLVVTASYHMPRAIAELARALPETQLYPLPVVPPGAIRSHRTATAAGSRGVSQVPGDDGRTERGSAGARNAADDACRSCRMTLIRSALFNLFFFAATFVLTVAVATPVRFAAPRQMLNVARLWARIMVWAARVLCGIRLHVSGLEHIDNGAALIASRHQSAFDTFVWLTLVPRCCYVLKRELLRIPLFGPLLPLAGMIAVDREGGANALRGLMREGDACGARAASDRDLSRGHAGGTRVRAAAAARGRSAGGEDAPAGDPRGDRLGQMLGATGIPQAAWHHTHPDIPADPGWSGP